MCMKILFFYSKKYKNYFVDLDIVKVFNGVINFDFLLVDIRNISLDNIKNFVVGSIFCANVFLCTYDARCMVTHLLSKFIILGL